MTEESQSQTLGADERLKSKVLIEKLFKEGASVFSYPIKLIYLPFSQESDIHSLKFGVTVPKRNHRKAHTRNSLKRKIREAYRKHKPVINEEINLTHSYALMYILVDRKVSSYETILRAVKKVNQRFTEAIVNS